MKIKFIALDTNSYKTAENVDCINLNWEDSISDWVRLVKHGLKDIKKSDLVIGHSIGASVALIVNPKCKIKLYSPSPIFLETKDLLSDEMKEDLKNKFSEINNYSLNNIDVKPDIYVGEEELPLMKKTVETIKSFLNCSVNYIKGADHLSVIDNSNLINFRR